MSAVMLMSLSPEEHAECENIKEASVCSAVVIASRGLISG
jgi:hypothetical protein